MSSTHQPHDADGPTAQRSHSTTSLARLANGQTHSFHAEESDPRLDFCNAFWGQDDRGYQVVMARLRGAARTVDELRAFWKERIAIEEEYSRRLSKLSKTTLGRDEIGDLASSLQGILGETAQQASYHSTLCTELHQSVESPTTEMGVRLANLKRGLQASVEKSYKNKNLQESHVQRVGGSFPRQSRRSHPGQREIRVRLLEAQLVPRQSQSCARQGARESTTEAGAHTADHRPERARLQAVRPGSSGHAGQVGIGVEGFL